MVVLVNTTAFASKYIPAVFLITSPGAALAVGLIVYFIKAYDAEHKYMAVQKIVVE